MLPGVSLNYFMDLKSYYFLHALSATTVSNDEMFASASNDQTSSWCLSVGGSLGSLEDTCRL